jgi:hypothetical protein
MFTIHFNEEGLEQSKRAGSKVEQLGNGEKVLGVGKRNYQNKGVQCNVEHTMAMEEAENGVMWVAEVR